VIKISEKIPQSILRQAKDKSTPVTVRIGKEGITDSVVSELSDQLSKRGVVKAKANRGLLSGSSERAQAFEGLADATGSRLIHSRGNTAVFWSGRD
jgi:RNA-binding protein YhbY|tara:strand:+ start:209 stop:496 length:288 start_codon:yes stop_codon:yes gene_type:complete